LFAVMAAQPANLGSARDCFEGAFVFVAGQANQFWRRVVVGPSSSVGVAWHDLDRDAVVTSNGPHLF